MGEESREAEGAWDIRFVAVEEVEEEATEEEGGFREGIGGPRVKGDDGELPPANP